MTAFPVLMPIAARIGNPTANEGVGVVADPLDALFAASRKGAWWSPRMLAQADSSAVTDVADRSPNANNVAQSDIAQQPTFIISGGIGRARFDTTADFLELPASAGLDIGATPIATIIAAIRHTKSTTGIICETANLGTTAAGMGLIINNSGAGNIGGALRETGTDQTFRNVTGAGSVPRSYVVSMTVDTTLATANQLAFRVDGIAVPSTSLAATGVVAGDIGSTAFSIGRRAGSATVYFGSDLFDLIVLGGAVDPALLAQTEAYLFQECGF